MEKYVWLVFVIAWVSCAFVAWAGLCFTGKTYCILVMVLPLFISYKVEVEDKK